MLVYYYIFIIIYCEDSRNCRSAIQAVGELAEVVSALANARVGKHSGDSLDDATNGGLTFKYDGKNDRIFKKKLENSQTKNLYHKIISFVSELILASYILFIQSWSIMYNIVCIWCVRAKITMGISSVKWSDISHSCTWARLCYGCWKWNLESEWHWPINLCSECLEDSCWL